MLSVTTFLINETKKEERQVNLNGNIGTTNRYKKYWRKDSDGCGMMARR